MNRLDPWNSRGVKNVALYRDNTADARRQQICRCRRCGRRRFLADTERGRGYRARPPASGPQTGARPPGAVRRWMACNSDYDAVNVRDCHQQ